MKSIPALTLSDACLLGEAALAEARRNGWAVTVAVCDGGGHLLWMQRLDGAPPMSAQVAPGKAQACVLAGKSTKGLEDMINQGRTAGLKLPVVALEGGEPVVVDGTIVGAVGVSGVRADQDVQIAKAGLAALPGA